MHFLEPVRCRAPCAGVWRVSVSHLSVGDGCRARWAAVRVGARPRHLPHHFSAAQGAEPPSACLVNCWMINANALSAIVSPPKARATSAR